MISVENITKNYGSVQALKDISFQIAQGEFYGLLGPNGAGKTTTISIMSTILEPDSGTVTIDGLDLNRNKNACKKMIGVVPQEIALYNELSAMDNLLFWGSLFKIPKPTLLSLIESTLQLFGLYDRRNDKIKTYSGGMKRRINIASALLHQPKVLFMDEPTVGIDPQSRNLIFEVIEKLNKEGMTIVYTTHYMEEAERLCHKIGIIDNGTIIAQGSLDELRKSSKIKETIAVTFNELTGDNISKITQKWPDVIQKDNEVQFVTDNGSNDLQKIISLCNEVQLAIQRIDIQKVSLENIFLSLTGKKLRD